MEATGVEGETSFPDDSNREIKSLRQIIPVNRENKVKKNMKMWSLSQTDHTKNGE